MKILVIASTFPSSDADSVPGFVRDQIIALKKYDPSLSFTVLAPHDIRSRTSDFRSLEYYDEYRFHYFWPTSFEKLAGRGIMPTLKSNPLYYFVVPFLFLGEFFALLMLVRKAKPDIIYAHWFTPQAAVGRVVAAITNTPLVFTTHASDVAVWHKIPIVGPAIVRAVIRKTYRFTAVSRRSMAKLAVFFSKTEWRSLEERSKIIPMGVAVSPAKFKNKKDESSIVFIGRLAEKKGIRYLIDAFETVSQHQQGLRLIIAGDGPLKSTLEQQAKISGAAASIDFIGYTTGKKKQALLESAGVFVVPSIITASGDAEGLPVSLMEGLAAGNICIATHESGADDILADETDGYLIPEKDTDALSKALETALEMTTEKKQVMRQAAAKTAAQFSWETIAKQHKEFLFDEQYDKTNSTNQ